VNAILEEATRVEFLDDERFSASLSEEWEIRGPLGGYVLGVALRAAGAAGAYPQPVSASCSFVRRVVAGPVSGSVRALRRGRSACAQRVSLEQDGALVMDVVVWSTPTPDDDGGELDHDDACCPVTGGPTEAAARGPDDALPSFWRNVETIPVTLAPVWPPESALDPLWREWIRLRQPIGKHDAWLGAAYIATLMDLHSWIPAWRRHAWRNLPFVAASLALHVTFSGMGRATDWLLTDGHAPLVVDGVIGWTGRLWSDSGQLVASGTGETLWRKV